MNFYILLWTFEKRLAYKHNLGLSTETNTMVIERAHRFLLTACQNQYKILFLKKLMEYTSVY